MNITGDLMFIKEITIKNFKSLKSITLPFNKLTVFIGDTNTGKSNIIELLSFLGAFANFDEDNFGSYVGIFVRYNSWIDLFYDRNIDNQIEIIISYSEGQKSKMLDLIIKGDDEGLKIIKKPKNQTLAEISYDGIMTPLELNELEDFKSVKFYNFSKNFNLDVDLDNQTGSILRPPDGRNLFQTIWASKERREFIKELFSLFGYRVVFDIADKKMLFQKQEGDIIVNFPLELLSDTLKATIFYYMALLSNKNSVLCLDEPESFMFPSHILDLAEDFAKNPENTGNQIILTTHNPYFLENLITKANLEDLNLFVCRYNDFQSDFKLLSKKDMMKINEMDLIMNIETFFGEEEDYST